MSISFLRKVVLADAVASGVMGLLLLVAAGPLTALLGLPTGLMRGVGAFLLVWMAALLFMLGRPALPAGPMWLVVAVNVLWVVESVMVLVLGWLQPTALGIAFILAQAAVVAVFALLQARGARTLAAGQPRRQPSLA